jgi:hypothetical protein
VIVNHKSDNARVAKNASSRKLLSNLKEVDASERIVPMAKQNMALLPHLSSLKEGPSRYHFWRIETMKFLVGCVGLTLLALPLSVHAEGLTHVSYLSHYDIITHSHFDT